MDKYKLITLALFMFAVASVAFAAELPKTIEEAIRQNGGTYGTIDTSNPHAANNFVQTIFDQGLTNSDGNGNCWSMNIRPGVKISCALSANADAYYEYEGKKGEKVTITISAQNFIPQVTLTDANGDMEFIENKQKQHSFIFTKILPYTGDFTFEVYDRDAKEGDSFTISLSSDVSNIKPDIRTDSLIEGGKYSVRELKLNQSKTPRKFLTDAYVSYVYKAPVCPPKAICEVSMSPNIIISDNNEIKSGYSVGVSDATLYIENHKTESFELGKKYQFEVSVQNISNTPQSDNEFNLITIKDSSGIFESTVKDGDVEISSKSFITRFMDWFKGILR